MSNVIPASAIGTLMSTGYTEVEAKRIRSFLTRRFQLYGNTLPSTNIEAWLAHRAVKHFLQQTKERGVFTMQQPSGYLNLMPHEKMRYVTDDWLVEFSTTEFIRHFGDALFTDMDPVEEKRIIRLNEDGSFVIKARRLEQLFRDMTHRAERATKQPNSCLDFSNYDYGRFVLPQEETYTAKDLLTLFTNGRMAKEYQFGSASGRDMISGIDDVAVTKYLYFLYCEKMKGATHGAMFDWERSAILEAYRSRRNYVPFPHLLYCGIYFADGQFVDKAGNWSIVEPVQQNMMPIWNYSMTSDMARINYGGHILATPIIPTTVRDYFTQDEWSAALV